MTDTLRRCAFLSTDNLEDFCVYDNMLFEPLKRLGWHAEEVSWRDDGVDWGQYEAVLIRSTWDYQDAPQAFIACLERIERSPAVLENSLDVVKWNISKDYLQDLQSRGVPVVPTLWFNQFDAQAAWQAYETFATQELIIKPLVSANADHTYRLAPDQFSQQKATLADHFTDRPHMVQPFVKAIVEEGEYSLFYFAGDYSHTILKRPKAQDFRVQEEHGGQLACVEPSPDLLTVAEQTLAALPELPLYARLDFVRGDEGFMVMEVELIEPSLYFNMDPASPQRFADAFARRYSAN